MKQIQAQLREHFHGVLVSVIVAVAASFLSEHYHASAMLFALLLGMAINFLSLEGPCVAGIKFSASTVLRIGVALLGMRITFAQIADMGRLPILIVLAGVVATILVGIVAARVLGFRWEFGMLTGGAVAICGASAALAIAAALPKHPQGERATIFTVIGVSALSTLAMVVYPLIVHAMGFDAREAGVFLGATIHDVAQVVGAGYGMSNETGDGATVVKLLRVTMLLPVILVMTLVVRWRKRNDGGDLPMLPWFLILFAALVVLNSLGVIPIALQKGLNTLAGWCLVTAIAAIGIKTQLKDMSTVGLRPILLMVGETVFLALLVLAMLYFATPRV